MKCQVAGFRGGWKARIIVSATLLLGLTFNAIARDPAQQFDGVGPQPGDQLADIPLRTLDDKPFSFHDSSGYSQVLLVTSSLTCPKSRSRWPELKRLAETHRKLHVVLIYVIEAHPVGDVCPYKGVEDVTEANRLEKILHRQPTTLDDRLDLARDFCERMGLDQNVVQVCVDTMDNLAWISLGGAPNLALLVDGDRLVTHRQGWFNAAELKKHLKEQPGKNRRNLTQHNDAVEKKLRDNGIYIRNLRQAFFVDDDLRKAEELIQLVPEIVNYVRPNQQGNASMNERTLLVQAAGANRAKVAELLLRHGAEVNAQTRLKPSALHYAAKEGHLEMVKLLIRHSADINLPAFTGKVMPIEEAVIYQRRAVADELLKFGAKARIFCHIGIGDRDAVHDAIAADPARALIPDGWDRTPLAYAAAVGDQMLIELLLRAHALPNNSNWSSEQPLMWAARNDHPEAAQLLLAAGASPDARCHGEGTALRIAVSTGHAAVVDILLQHHADIEDRDDFSMTPLHLAALKGNTTIAKLLLAAGANPNAQQKEYDAPCGDGHSRPSLRTPLHFAAEKLDCEMVRVLLAGGGTIEAESSEGFTPLYLAANVDKRKYSRPLDAEGIERQKATLRELLAAGAVASGKLENGTELANFLTNMNDEQILKDSDR